MWAAIEMKQMKYENEVLIMYMYSKYSPRSLSLTDFVGLWVYGLDVGLWVYGLGVGLWVYGLGVGLFVGSLVGL